MCTSFKKKRPLSIPRTILPSLALRLKFQIHAPISSSSEKSRPVLDGRRGLSMESMVTALRSLALGGGTHAPNFSSSGRFGRTKNEGQSTNGGYDMSGVCSSIAINDFPALCISCAFGRRGLAFLDDSNGASILARGSYGRGILRHMPSTNPPRTYLGSASPVGEQRFTFRFTTAPCLWQSPLRIDRLVHPSREQCFHL